MKNSFEKKKVAGVLYIVAIYLAAILIAVNVLASVYFDIISQTLNQDTFRREELATDEEYDSEYFKSDYEYYSDLRADEEEFARQIQEEGTVLLQNSGLPLSGPKKVTFLGLHSAQAYFYCGGNSSGSAPSYVAPTFTQAFEGAGYEVNATMVNYYNTQSSEPAVSSFPAEVRNSVSQYNELAVIVISRGGAEGNDVTAPDLQLTENEIGLIDFALANFEDTVVLLNTANNPNCGYLKGKDLSVLWIGTPGDTGIGIIPEILLGERNPSGHLVDTIVYDMETSPASYSYGDLNMYQADGTTALAGGKYLNYYENIYMGYRYYETRYADVVTDRPNVGSFDYESEVIYPFGYGLSYTQFAYSDFSIQESAAEITVNVTVTNTGSVAGKDAVQIYMQSPYTEYDIEHGVEKSAVQLVGFTKTEVIQPGEAQEVTLTVSKEEMKAYDDEYAQTYIVDAGEYFFTAGQNVHDALNNILAAQGYSVADGMTEEGDADLVASIVQEELDNTTYATTEDGVAITNQFAEVDLSNFKDDIVYVTRSDWEGTFPTVRGGDLIGNAQMLEAAAVTYEYADDSQMPTTGQNNGMTLIEMKGLPYDHEDWSAFLDQITASELMYSYTHGGYMTAAIQSIVKPPSVDVDGTSKVNGTMMDGSECFTFMGACVIASTWNTELAAQEGYFVSQDALMVGVTGWYAPGMNMHRLPTSGRNPDYYSEDPLLTGTVAAAVVKEATSNGLVTYIKHFALNDQETMRSRYSTFATEQAVRELYLKPFQMAIEEGGANGIMSSMNYVGLKSANYCSNLLVNVLRGEWGFEGIVITDASWNGSSRDMLLNGTDLILNPAAEDIPNYASDAAVMNALREAAHRICYSFVNSNLMNGYAPTTIMVPVTPPWQIILYVVDAVLGIVIVGGAAWLTVSLVKGKKEEVTNG